VFGDEAIDIVAVWKRKSPTLSVFGVGANFFPLTGFAIGNV
jgi:hypothetical protein